LVSVGESKKGSRDFHYASLFRWAWKKENETLASGTVVTSNVSISFKLGFTASGEVDMTNFISMNWTHPSTDYAFFFVWNFNTTTHFGSTNPLLTLSDVGQFGAAPNGKDSTSKNIPFLRFFQDKNNVLVLYDHFTGTLSQQFNFLILAPSGLEFSFIFSSFSSTYVD
jgi:hypothetical protein